MYSVLCKHTVNKKILYINVQQVDAPFQKRPLLVEEASGATWMFFVTDFNSQMCKRAC